MKNQGSAFLPLLLMIILTACATGQAPALPTFLPPTSSPLPSLTKPPTYTPLPTSTRTPTAKPSQTPVPTPSRTPTPKATATLTRVLVATSKAPTLSSSLVEKLQFEVSLADWEVGFSDFSNPNVNIIEFIHPGDDIDHWQELLTIQNLALRPGFRYSTPRSFYEGIKALDLKKCPNLAHWKILEQDPASLLYEWQREKACPERPVQHELSRILYGRDNIFRIAFTVDVFQMPDEARENWIQTLKSAKIILSPSQ